MPAPTSPAPSDDGSPLSGFVSGLFGRSGVSLVGMVLFALLELAAVSALTTPRGLAKAPLWLVMKNRTDDYARLTVLAERLRFRKDRPLSVVYLGASVAQRALFDSLEPAPIERRLTAAVGERVVFWSLYAAGETLDESSLVASQIPNHFRGVVALVVDEDKDDDRSRRLALLNNPGIVERLPLEAPGAGPRLGFDGRRMRSSGIYFIDHLEFFSARREALLHPFPTSTPYPRGGLSRPTPPAPGAEQRTIEARYLDSPMALLKQTDVLHRTIETAKSRGAVVVLVEAPSNPYYQSLKDERHDGYEPAVRAFAASEGVDYWNFNEAVGAHRRDFEDAFHLGSPRMRKRYQAEFCKHLAEKLRPLAHPTGATSEDEPDRDEAENSALTNDDAAADEE